MRIDLEIHDFNIEIFSNDFRFSPESRQGEISIPDLLFDDRKKFVEFCCSTPSKYKMISLFINEICIGYSTFFVNMEFKRSVYDCDNIYIHDPVFTDADNPVNGSIIDLCKSYRLFNSQIDDKIPSRCIYIDWIWVDENYRNQGFSKIMINTCEKIAKSIGEDCFLSTLFGNGQIYKHLYIEELKYTPLAYQLDGIPNISCSTHVPVNKEAFTLLGKFNDELFDPNIPYGEFSDQFIEYIKEDIEI